MAALVALLGPSLVEAGDRVRLVLNGAWSPTTRSFGQTLNYTEYLETASVDARYATSSAFSPDLGIQTQVFRKLGVYVGFTSTNRDEKGHFTASVPHPLYLDRPRSIEGDLSGYGYKERGFHFDLAFGAASGHFDYAVFAGVSLFAVEADLVDTVRYDQTYPYDSVTLREAPRRVVKNSPTGFNAGGRLDYRFGQAGHFGLGVQLRYSSAKAKLKASETGTVNVDAGGLHVGAGARLYF